MEEVEKKVAVIAIIVENREKVENINNILHEAREYIVGRLGIPYKERDISVISVVIDAPMTVISSISGKLGMIDGVKSKVLTTK